MCETATPHVRIFPRKDGTSSWWLSMETWVIPPADAQSDDDDFDDDEESEAGHVVRFVVPHETGEAFVQFCFLRDGLAGANGPANRLHLIELGCSAVRARPLFADVAANLRVQTDASASLLAQVEDCDENERTGVRIDKFIEQFADRLQLGFAQDHRQLRDLDRKLDEAVEHAKAS